MLGRVKYLLAIMGAVALFIAAANNLSHVRRISTTGEYYVMQLADLTWLQSELFEMRVDAASIYRNDPSISKKDLRLAFDILWARIATERKRTETQDIGSLARYRPVLAKLAADLAEIDGLVSALKPGDYETWSKIEAVMDRTAPEINDMNNLAYDEMYAHATTSALEQREAVVGAERLLQTLTAMALVAAAYLLWQLRKNERKIATLSEQEAETRRQAITDPLTLINNRRHFDERMRAINDGQWGGELETLMIDLDGFKQVNDLHGHEVGDSLLRVVASRLRVIAPPKSLLARLGGDEFAMVVEAGTARPVAENVIRTLSQTIPDAVGLLQISASIGISQRKPGPDVTRTMLREADLALYSAKSRGKSCFVHFDDLMAGQVGELEQHHVV